MKTKLDYKYNFYGGNYLINNEIERFKYRPQMNFIINEEKFPVEYKTINGTSYDGRPYYYNKTAIGITLNNKFLTKFIPIENFIQDGFEVYIELIENG
jgi:hypothetical protein